ncbi:MAG TPA: nucleoside hydrolase [Candidatus Limnocylindrales bacterium]
MAARRKVILDVDTGTDDAVALMVAALHPGLELVAATTVAGNVPLDRTTENTLRVLDHIGAAVPVHAGRDRPLVREPRSRPTTDRAGVSRIHGDFLDLPSSRSRPASERAVDFLIETFLAASDEITLVATGPETNVAAALRLEPRLAARIPHLVVMGGGHETGNVTPSAEFNVWADPEAAQAVFRAGIDRLTVVPLDATHRALVSLDDCVRLRTLSTPASTAAAAFVERRIRAYDETQPMTRPGAAPVHDALAVAILVEPGLVTTERVHADVETRGELTDGRTVFDRHRRGGLAPNAEVAFDADEAGFVRLLTETLGRTFGEA